LVPDDVITIILETGERRYLGREDLIQQRAFCIPVMFKRGDCQIGLGLESVIKASLVDARAVADVIDADRPIATFPDQLQSGLEELVLVSDSRLTGSI